MPQVKEAYEQDNKFYLKTFLLDDSVARNGMGVHPEYVPKNIHKFVGRPVILTPNFQHPHEFEHFKETKDYKQDVPELLKLQEPYSIGKIVDISTHANLQQAGNTNYSALLEITDPKAIEVLRTGKIPQYVSPSIYRINESDPVHSITDYEPLHIAIVDNPAYGFHKANIRQTCQGNKTECQRMLAQANNDGLGFCVEKTLNGLKNILQGHSSLVQNIPKKESIMVENNTNNSTQETTKVEETVTAPQQQVQEQQPAEQSQEQPINTQITGSPNLEQSQEPDDKENEKSDTEEGKPLQKETTVDESPCEKAAREFEEKIATYDKKIKEFEKFKANYEKQVVEDKIKSKRERIETAIPADYAGSEEARTEAIENFMKVPDEQLQYILNNFVTPVTKNVRQGSLARKPKVTDFVKTTGEASSNGKNVAQASFSRKLDELEMLSKFTGVDIVPKRRNEGGIM